MAVNEVDLFIRLNEAGTAVNREYFSFA